jgi:hypothetical protein
MNQVLLVILGIVLVAVGFLIALLVIPLFSSEKKTSKEIEARIAEQAIPKPLQPSAAQARGLRVWRDLQKDKLLVEMDGQVYEAVSQLSQLQRRFLSLTVTDLVAWMSQAAMGASSVPLAEPLQPTAYGEELGTKVTSTEKGILKPPAKLVQPESVKTHSPRASLAAQIDEILQERLASSNLAYRTIHLAELPNFGMSVQVDLQQYDSVEAIPDEEVRKLIHEAVEEWQKRSRLRQP